MLMTRPRMLSGTASWMLEKFESWTDDSSSIRLDELCTNLTIYWVTQTAGSAARYYFDSRLAELDSGPVTTPTGIALFPKDLLAAPHESAKRWFNLVRFTDMPAGGHFGPWEEPEAWAAEITAFFDAVAA